MKKNGMAAVMVAFAAGVYLISRLINGSPVSTALRPVVVGLDFSYFNRDSLGENPKKYKVVFDSTEYLYHYLTALSQVDIAVTTFPTQPYMQGEFADTGTYRTGKRITPVEDSFSFGGYTFVKISDNYPIAIVSHTDGTGSAPDNISLLELKELYSKGSGEYEPYYARESGPSDDMARVLDIGFHKMGHHSEEHYDTFDFSGERVTDCLDILRTVKHNEKSIGYAPVSLYTQFASRDSQMKVLTVNGLHCYDEGYPIKSTLYAIYRTDSINRGRYQPIIDELRERLNNYGYLCNQLQMERYNLQNDVGECV